MDNSACSYVVVIIKSVVNAAPVVSVAESHSLLRRATLQLVECGGAQGPLLLVDEVGIDVAGISVSFVDHPHVPRNFALDIRVGLVPQLALFLLFPRTPLHVVDGAANDLSLLVLFEVLVHELMLVARLKAHGCSLLASRELLFAHADLHRLLLLEERVCFLRTIHHKYTNFYF